MWWQDYKDYPRTSPMKHQKVEPGDGIIGCEMHDLNGWGEEYHNPVKKKRGGFLGSLLTIIKNKIYYGLNNGNP